jgi:hypothetical protein
MPNPDDLRRELALRELVRAEVTRRAEIDRQYDRER